MKRGFDPWSALLWSYPHLATYILGCEFASIRHISLRQEQAMTLNFGWAGRITPAYSRH